MIHDVLHHLPDRRRAWRSAQQLVLDDAVHVTDSVHERAHLRFVFRPGALERREIGKPIGGHERGHHPALPAFVPRPFRRVDVRQRVADRLEAVAEIAVVLIARQRVDRSEDAIARPVVVIEHRLQVLHVHGMILARMMRSSRGYSRSRNALPPSKSGCCLPARMPPPEFSPYSLFKASATSMPDITCPNGTKPCAS